jgi:UDP-N-acetyl-D-mannosaminuronate dehydrogenase
MAEQKVKIEVIAGVGIKGVAYAKGDVVEVSQSDALQLIAMRKAKGYEAPMVDRSIGLNTEDAAPLVKRTRKTKAK